ncbi:UNVERIFIED_CONTAM: hypothetical protein Slati_0207200 [Sesamum latifolium]|uniref:Reverse transcriptase zinc-binding domain-containing protein n=1 Tax=Sesamum latifolium TaxID=2727402 RepID=A0AAW2YBF2_9LAMI
MKHLALYYSMPSVWAESGALRFFVVLPLFYTFFADDTLIFCQTYQVIGAMLETYQGASGQNINFSKSSVAFSRNTREDLCPHITTELTIRRENKMELYLGLPSKGMISRFYWGNRGEHKTHWLSWDRLCESKLISGLGFRHLHLFNLAILAKKWWQILCHPESLLSRDWYVEKVRLFWPVDSEIILGIPCSRTGELDWQIWYYSCNGLFSIWSAYHLACSVGDKPCSSSIRRRQHSWWRKLWQARLPNKVKVFIWRVCHNALPSGLNLFKHIHGCSTDFPLCQYDSDDLLHVLGSCPFARQVWGLAPLSVIVPSVDECDVWLRLQHVAASLDVQEFGLFLCLCCGLTTLKSFCFQLGPPPRDCVKVNFDGATFMKGQELGIGVIARGLDGKCLAWLAQRILRRGYGELAEVIAACEAILLARRKGPPSIIIEGDCFCDPQTSILCS